MVYILLKHEIYQYGAIDDVLYVFTSEEEANKAAEQLNLEGGNSFIQFYVEEHEVIENGKLVWYYTELSDLQPITKIRHSASKEER